MSSFLFGQSYSSKFRFYYRKSKEKRKKKVGKKENTKNWKNTTHFKNIWKMLPVRPWNHECGIFPNKKKIELLHVKI